MGNVSREERVIGRSEEAAFFSSGTILPISCVFLAFGIMSSQSLFFPFALRVSAFVFMMAASLWDFRGLLFAGGAAFLIFLGACPRVFVELPSLIFFLILINTGFIVALLKRMWLAAQETKRKDLQRLKAWETHYHAFRRSSLEQLEEVKKTQEDLFFMEHQVQVLEKEKVEAFLEEDKGDKKLLEMLAASEEKSLALQKEVELLEEILAASFKETSEPKISRKKKNKEEVAQGMLF